MITAWVLAAALIGASPCPGVALRLDWVRTSTARSCPDGTAVAERIRNQLGCEPFAADPSLRFEVTVDAGEGQWRARMTRLDARGAEVGASELASVAEDCGVLADAVALAVTVAAEDLLDGGGVETPAPPRSTATSSVVSTRVILVPSTPGSAPPLSAPYESPPALTFRAEAALNLGTLPGPAGGVALQARWHPLANLGVGADLLVLPTQRTSTFGFGLVAGALAVCPELRRRPVTIGACARGYLGSLTAVVYSDAQPGDAGPFLWTALSASGFLEWALTRHLFLSLEAEGVIALPRRVFSGERQVDGVELEVHSEALVALQTRLGIGFRFDE